MLKSRVSRILGLILYVFVMGKLMDFDWRQMIQPKPFITVMVGMLILTLSQYKKRMKIEELLACAKFNILFAGFLASLLSILSYVTPANLGAVNSADIIGNLLHLLYGTIMYLMLNLTLNTEKKEEAGDAQKPGAPPATWYTEEFFRNFGLTNRECHVARKLLDNISNKEIASELFISESTAKKHIQNIYQKLQVSDRNGFRNLMQTHSAQASEKEMGGNQK